jgi:competence protein ComEC
LSEASLPVVKSVYRSTVLQTPDGRTLLYDAGAIQGPTVTRRNIVPFLRSQGITRIDEVLLSHADLDHYNGLPSLCEYFAIGQVGCTPTFTARDNPPVASTGWP